jgi:hypothetical protein
VNQPLTARRHKRASDASDFWLRRRPENQRVGIDPDKVEFLRGAALSDDLGRPHWPSGVRRSSTAAAAARAAWPTRELLPQPAPEPATAERPTEGDVLGPSRHPARVAARDGADVVRNPGGPVQLRGKAPASRHAAEPTPGGGLPGSRRTSCLPGARVRMGTSRGLGADHEDDQRHLLRDLQRQEDNRALLPRSTSTGCGTRLTCGVSWGAHLELPAIAAGVGVAWIRVRIPVLSMNVSFERSRRSARFLLESWSSRCSSTRAVDRSSSPLRLMRTGSSS